eukprot:scaffold4308_cov162-Ochromonas_danica.AAC.9
MRPVALARMFTRFCGAGCQNVNNFHNTEDTVTICRSGSTNTEIPLHLLVWTAVRSRVRFHAGQATSDRLDWRMVQDLMPSFAILHASSLSTRSTVHNEIVRGWMKDDQAGYDLCHCLSARNRSPPFHFDALLRQNSVPVWRSAAQWWWEVKDPERHLRGSCKQPTACMEFLERYEVDELSGRLLTCVNRELESSSIASVSSNCKVRIHLGLLKKASPGDFLVEIFPSDRDEP